LAAAHASGALVAVAATLLLAAGAAFAAWLDRAHIVVRVAALVSVALYAVVSVLGAVTLVTGSGPRDELHLLYGAALIAAFPLGFTFASEAPARPRSGTVAVVAVVALLLIWRLFSTG
jgi:heme A synthase